MWAFVAAGGRLSRTYAPLLLVVEGLEDGLSVLVLVVRIALGRRLLDRGALRSKSSSAFRSDAGPIRAYRPWF